MKNPLDHIRQLEVAGRTYIFGFLWKFGMLVYLQGGLLIHPLLLYTTLYITDRPLEGVNAFFSITSLAVFL